LGTQQNQKGKSGWEGVDAKEFERIVEEAMRAIKEMAKRGDGGEESDEDEESNDDDDESKGEEEKRVVAWCSQRRRRRSQRPCGSRS
jgi:cobalamin biosynthesis protein CobT